jgi:hypothetical protein
MKSTHILSVIVTTSVLCVLGQTSVLSAPLSCKIVQSAAGLGVGHAEARAAISPEDLKLGYVATGGGCLLQPGAAGEHYGYPEKSVPDAQGYTCSQRSINDNDGARVVAYVTACRQQ